MLGFGALATALTGMSWALFMEAGSFHQSFYIFVSERFVLNRTSDMRELRRLCEAQLDV